MDWIRWRSINLLHFLNSCIWHFGSQKKRLMAMNEWMIMDCKIWLVYTFCHTSVLVKSILFYLCFKLAAGLIKTEGDSSPKCWCVIHWSGCYILSPVCLILLIRLVYVSKHQMSKWSAYCCWQSLQLPAEAGEISNLVPILHLCKQPAHSDIHVVSLPNVQVFSIYCKRQKGKLYLFYNLFFKP